jgi:hypothetical protein
MHKFNAFNCQILYNLAAQTVSPFFHEKQPARDAARWAKPFDIEIEAPVLKVF